MLVRVNVAVVAVGVGVVVMRIVRVGTVVVLHPSRDGQPAQQSADHDR